MFDKLEDLRIRLDEILNELQEPDVANDQNRFRKLMKEQNDLTPIVEAYNEYKECKQAIEDSLEMLEEESDEEMRELAKEELNDNKKRVEELEQELKILLLPKDRQTLYDRINRRVEEMFSMGLPEEARRLFAQNPSPTAAQAIGYKELRPYLEGKEELSAALEKVKQASRNYAKRQLTWFRREEQALVLDCALSAEEKCAQTLSALQKEGFLDERNLQA